MKNFKMFTVAALMAMATISVVFTSCNPDACKDVVCNNDGVCNDGTCTCEAGFYGESCDLDANSAFVGTWSAREKANGATTFGTPYPVTVTADASDNKLFYLKDYGNYLCTAGSYNVTASSNNGVDYSIASTACGTNFTGSGSLSTTGTSSQIDGTYTATYGTPTTTDQVIIEMTK